MLLNEPKNIEIFTMYLFLGETFNCHIEMVVRSANTGRIYIYTYVLIDQFNWYISKVKNYVVLGYP